MGIEQDIQQFAFKSEYNKAVINLIYTCSWLNQEYLNLLRPHGLTLPQFNILRILRGQHPQPCTVNLLIDRMLDKSSNASRIVDKLESKDLVVREQCKDDRRAVDVLISQKGLDLLKVLDEKMEERESQTKMLTEEESKILNQLLDKMRTKAHSDSQ